MIFQGAVKINNSVISADINSAEKLNVVENKDEEVKEKKTSKKKSNDTENK